MNGWISRVANWYTEGGFIWFQVYQYCAPLTGSDQVGSFDDLWLAVDFHSELILDKCF